MARGVHEIDIHPTLGTRVRQARRAAGLTQIDLAEIADSHFREREQLGEADLPHPTQSSVSAVENGQERATHSWVQWLEEFASGHGFESQPSVQDLTQALQEFDPHSGRQRDIIEIGKQLLLRGSDHEAVSAQAVELWKWIASAEGVIDAALGSERSRT